MGTVVMPSKIPRRGALCKSGTFAPFLQQAPAKGALSGHNLQLQGAWPQTRPVRWHVMYSMDMHTDDQFAQHWLWELDQLLRLRGSRSRVPSRSPCSWLA